MDEFSRYDHLHGDEDEIEQQRKDQKRFKELNQAQEGIERKLFARRYFNKAQTNETI